MSAACVLAALLRVHARDGRATVRSVRDEAGTVYIRDVQRALVVLRREGLVAWEPSTQGTLRPLVAPIPEPAPTPLLKDGTVDVRTLLAGWDHSYNEGLRS